MSGSSGEWEASASSRVKRRDLSLLKWSLSWVNHLNDVESSSEVLWGPAKGAIIEVPCVQGEVENLSLDVLHNVMDVCCTPQQLRGAAALYPS